MATGIQSFNDPANIGPLYPFPGTEVALAVIGIVLWIVWHIVQNRAETAEWRDAVDAFDERLLLPGADEPARPVVPAVPAVPAAPATPPPAAGPPG